jgi:hypothetical protein
VLQVGQPSAGLSKFSPDSGPLRFFVGSLKDMRAELANIQGELSAGSFSSAAAVRDLQQRAGELRAEIDKLEPKERALTQAILDGAQALREPTGLTTVTSEAHAAAGAVDDLVGSLERAMARLAAFEAAGPTVHLTGVVDAIKVPAEAPQVKVPVILQFQQFDEMAKHLADLDAARRAAESAGLSDEASRRAGEEAAQVLVLTAAWRKYVQTLIDGHASAEELAEAMRRFEEIAKSAGAEDLTKSEHALRAAAQAARNLGDEFGGVTDSLGTVLSSVDDLQSALNDLKAPKLSGFGALAALASGAGAIASLVSGLGSIFGPSPAQQAHDRILQDNNQALANLSSALDRFGETASSIGNAQQGVAAIVGSDIRFGEPSDQPTDRAREILAQYGLTLEQVNKIAKDNGITLLDHGRVVDDAFTQLAEALGITADILTHWGKAFDDQRKLQDLEFRAQGITRTPAEHVNDLLDSITAQTGDAIDAKLRGLSAGTEGGRDAIRDAVFDLLERVRLNDISLDDLGEFKNVQEFVDSLGLTLDGLDAFNEGLDAVTDSLLNVPQIFKLARVRFESMLPEIPITPGTPAGPPQVPTTVPPEPPVAIPPLVIDSLGRLPDVLATLPSGMAESTDRLGNMLPGVMRGALDGASVGIVDNQFDALLDALRATVPATGAASDRGSGDLTINGDVYVDARTKPVRQAWDETLAMLRQDSRSGAIPLAGVRTQ